MLIISVYLFLFLHLFKSYNVYVFLLIIYPVCIM